MVKNILIGIALAFMGLFLVMPLLVVFTEAFSAGIADYFTAITDPNVGSAITLTLIIALVVVPANLIFGICASWCICLLYTSRCV